MAPAPLDLGELWRLFAGTSGRVALILAAGMLVLVVVEWLFTWR